MGSSEHSNRDMTSMTDAERIAMLEQQLVDAKADTERVADLYNRALAFNHEATEQYQAMAASYTKDSARVNFLQDHWDWALDALTGSLYQADEDNLRDAVDLLMAEHGGKP